MTTEKILLEFDPEKKYLLPALQKISAAFSYVSLEDAQKTAEYFKLPLSQVYETATFYDDVKTKKPPFLTIKVCAGTNCVVGGSWRVIKEIENLLSIKAGDDFNPKVKLEIISCLGQCGQGPVVIINDKTYQRVSPTAVGKILEEWR